MARSEKCHYCGGRVRGVSGPGRWHHYRGVDCELPHDLEVDTCTECHREWMSFEQVERMSEAFESQRDAQLARPSVVPVNPKMGTFVIGSFARAKASNFDRLIAKADSLVWRGGKVTSVALGVCALTATLDANTARPVFLGTRGATRATDGVAASSPVELPRLERVS